MASEAPADGPSLSAAEAWSIEHEAPLHSCPGCGAKTASNDVCADCSKTPGDCVNCDAETTEGVCDICDPGPLLAEIADARVSPEVVRLAVEAAVAAEREECAAALEQSAAKLSAAGVIDLAEAFGTMAQALRARGRVSIG